MKKLLLLALLLFPSAAHADSITAGVLGLIKPSTGVAVAGRNWGDKINSNFDMIAATAAKAIAGLSAIATDTTTVNSRFNNVATDTTTIANRPANISFYDNTGTFLGNITTLKAGPNVQATISGSSGTMNATGGLASATVAGSTQTMTFKVSSVFFSTISACGIPLACHTWGPSSATIVAAWADAYAGSTVGWTRVDIVVSTGGKTGVLGPNRFPPISLSTATDNGLAAFSGVVSSGVPIFPGEWIGVAISSLAVSGRVTQGLEVHIDYWEKGRY